MLFERSGLFFDEELAGRLEGIRTEDVTGEGVEDSVLEGLAGDAAFGTITVAIGTCAEVGLEARAAALFGGMAIEGRAATGAASQAGEDKGRIGVARMILRSRVDMMMTGIMLVAFLAGVPDGAGDDGIAVVLDGQVAKLEDADVEFIGPEGAVGIDRAVEMEFAMDTAYGGASGVHLEGFLHSRHKVRVGSPAGGGVRGAIASFPNNKRFTQKSTRGNAGDAAIELNEVTQAALDINREIDDVLFILVVNEGFEDAAFGSLGDVVVEGIEDVTEIADLGAVEGGIVHVAGETVVLPDNDAALGAAAMAEGVHHGVEIITANGGGAAAGFVLEEVGDEQVVLGGPGAQGGFLLGDGKVLVFVAGVTQVGEEGGAG